MSIMNGILDRLLGGIFESRAAPAPAPDVQPLGDPRVDEILRICDSCTAEVKFNNAPLHESQFATVRILTNDVIEGPGFDQAAWRGLKMAARNLGIRSASQGFSQLQEMYVALAVSGRGRPLLMECLREITDFGTDPMIKRLPEGARARQFVRDIASRNEDRSDMSLLMGRIIQAEAPPVALRSHNAK